MCEREKEREMCECVRYCGSEKVLLHGLKLDSIRRPYACGFCDRSVHWNW